MKKEFQKRLLSSFVLIPLSLFFIVKGKLFFNFFLIVCFFVTCYEWFMMSKKKKYHLFGYIFLFFSFYSAYALRHNFGNESLIIFMLIIITCISTDIGGYIFGNLFKGPKLIKISPKKTYSGMIGSFLMPLIIIYLLINNSNFFYNEYKEFTNELLFIILSISTISQIGDILISYFKRLSKIKDTGKIIPGHGGLLDRIDGMIFAFPFSFLLFSLNI